MVNWYIKFLLVTALGPVYLPVVSEPPTYEHPWSCSRNSEILQEQTFYRRCFYAISQCLTWRQMTCFLGGNIYGIESKGQRCESLDARFIDSTSNRWVPHLVQAFEPGTRHIQTILNVALWQEMVPLMWPLFSIHRVVTWGDHFTVYVLFVLKSCVPVWCFKHFSFITIFGPYRPRGWTVSVSSCCKMWRSCPQ